MYTVRNFKERKICLEKKHNLDRVALIVSKIAAGGLIFFNNNFKNKLVLYTK